MIKKIIDSGST